MLFGIAIPTSAFNFIQLFLHLCIYALVLGIKFLSRRNLTQFIEDGIEKRAKAFVESSRNDRA